MKVIDCVQGSPEWLTARAGCITSSRISDVLAKIKKGESASRRNLRCEIVAERLTGRTTGHFLSNDMVWGIEQEPFARAAYEVTRDLMTDQVGFVLHSALEHAGASPDGLVGDKGLIEIKCPRTTTHIEYILAGEVPSEYHAQMLWQMDCCERSWCDFVSYDPRMPERHQLFVKRFERDDTRLAEMQKEVRIFEAEVQQLIRQLETGEKSLEIPLKQSLEAVGQ